MNYTRTLGGFLIGSFLFSSAMPLLAAPSPSTEDSLCALHVSGYTASRLTRNRAGKYFVVPLEEGRAVWTEQPENGAPGGKIILFNGTNQRVLTEQGIAGSLSAAASDKIVWQEKTGGEGSFRTDIFFFDGTRVRRLTSPDGDLTNFQPTVNASGKVAWVRRISDLRVDTSGTTPRTVFGESRIMMFDGRTTRSVSEAGDYNAPKFFGESLSWSGIENAQQHQNGLENRRSVYLLEGSRLRSHVLADAPAMSEWPILGERGVIYGVQAPTSSEGMYRYYDWSTDATRDVGRYTFAMDPESVLGSRAYTWRNESDSRTSFWTGSLLREVSRLLPTAYQHLKAVDISVDDGKALYQAYTYEDGSKTNGNPTWTGQIFSYDVSGNVLTQFTNAPSPRVVERRTGATRAWYGNNGEVYWVVATPETDYRTNDLCYARPAKAGVPDASSVDSSDEVAAPDASSSDMSCDEEEMEGNYVDAMKEAGKVLKQASLTAFDRQVEYRVRAVINKNRLNTVKNALRQARTKFEQGMDAFISSQTRSLQTKMQNNPDSTLAPTLTLTQLNTAWTNATRSLLLYANSADKAVITRVLTQAKTAATNQYKAKNQEHFSAFQQDREVCQEEVSNASEE